MVIRIARPGEPTRLIDCGPAHGRVMGQNYGGSIVVAGSAPVNAEQRAKKVAQVAAWKLAKRLREHERYVADKDKALERQRRYRERMRQP